MKNVIKDLLDSFNNKAVGYSGRKLSAFAGVVTGIYITAFQLPATQQINALYAWLTFALLCLGIITAEHVLKFKNGEKTDPTND